MGGQFEWALLGELGSLLAVWSAQWQDHESQAADPSPQDEPNLGSGLRRTRWC